MRLRLKLGLMIVEEGGTGIEVEVKVQVGARVKVEVGVEVIHSMIGVMVGVMVGVKVGVGVVVGELGSGSGWYIPRPKIRDGFFYFANHTRLLFFIGSSNELLSQIIHLIDSARRFIECAA